MKGLWLPFQEPPLPYSLLHVLGQNYPYSTCLEATTWQSLANESITIPWAAVIGWEPGMWPDWRRMRVEMGVCVLLILGKQSFLSPLQKLEETITLLVDGAVLGGDVMEALQWFCWHTWGGSLGGMVSLISHCGKQRGERQKPNIWFEVLDQTIPEENILWI